MDHLLNILQNKAINEIIIDRKMDEKYIPYVKKTVTYIVSAVIFNDKEEILLIQEAKSTCKGLWYLPAGRMEANETIEEAMKREVEEETGLKCQLECLISVQVTSQQWFRFNFVCSITGGTLKTKPDAESLQAKWFPLTEVYKGKSIRLRCRDIISVVKDGHYFYNNQMKLLKILPIQSCHRRLIMRLVVVFHDKEKNEFHAVFGRKPTDHLPVVGMGPGPCNHQSFLKEILGESETKVKLVLCLEHCGRPKYIYDGICISVLIEVAGGELPKLLNEKYYQWLLVDDEAVRSLLAKNLVELEGPRIIF